MRMLDMFCGAGGLEVEGYDTHAEWSKAMEIDWMLNIKSIAEAIPPAYSKFIGARVLCYLESV